MTKIGRLKRIIAREKIFLAFVLSASLLFLLANASCVGNMVYTSWLGPFEKTVPELLTMAELPADTWSGDDVTWVSIEADAVYPLSTSYTDYHLDGDVNYTAYATVIQIDDYLLVVELDDPPAEMGASTTFNGLVKVFNHAPCCPFHDEILREFNQRYPDVDGEFLSIILARPSRVIDNNQAYSVIILIWVGLCCLGILSLALLIRNPRKHRLLRRLRYYGDSLKVLGEIEYELESHLIEDDKQYAFTENWFVYSPYRNFQAVRYEDIIWMYNVKTIFESKFHIYDRYGRGIRLNKPPEWVTEMLNQDEAPWAENEHDLNTQLEWYFRRKGFVSRIDTIRNDYEKPKKRRQPPPADSIVEWD